MDRPVLSLDRPFTYELPEEIEAGVGSLVQVSFHGRSIRGWILGPGEAVPRMLPVRKALSPVRFFDQRMLELFRWMAGRYIAPLASVIARSHPPRVVSEESDAGSRPGAVTGTEWSPAALFDRYRNGGALADAVGKEGGGAFRLRPVPEEEQRVAVEAVRATLETGRTAIVLVPEAEPVPATARALLDALGEKAVLYLGGDRRERYRTWLDIAGGRYRCVVGTRPAVFAPVADLGLIWVSRESHPGHREERSPYYHVRDVALTRASLGGAACVMASLCPSVEAAATPAVDVWPSSRSWPPVEVVRPGPEGRAPRLLSAIKQARRAFLFQPLPGYGIARVCRGCSEPAACSTCGGTLRLESGEVRCLVCRAPGRCAVCGASSFGVVRSGAERVEQWARGVSPVPVRRGAGPPDSVDPGVVVGGGEAVKDVAPPALDLVGILDADLAARRPGLAAMERALATWMEAAAWARPSGRVIVQASEPGHPAIQSLVAGNPERFHRRELRRREEAGFPAGAPVFRLVGDSGLAPAVEETGPLTVLSSGLADQTVCLVAVRPERLPAFGAAIRALVERGVVTRVEAEPHL